MSIILNRAIEYDGFQMKMEFSTPFKCQPFVDYEPWEKAVRALSATHPSRVSIIEASDQTLSAWDEHQNLLGQFGTSGIGWLHVVH